MSVKFQRVATRSVLLAMQVFFVGLLFGSISASLSAEESLQVRVISRTAKAPGERCAVLLHGLARTSSSMNKLGRALNDAGWHTANVDYPSRKHPIALLAPSAVAQGVSACRALGATTIDTVTHSLGGILVRYFLAEETIEGFGRLVMLGPPNHGSEVVDKLGGIPGFAAFNGPAGSELGTDSGSIPSQLGPINVDAAVIAGTTSINLLLSTYLPNPDDGKVSVASARLPGMCAMLTIPVSHPFLMKDDAAIAQVIAYLSTGEFIEQNDNTPEVLACEARGEE